MQFDIEVKISLKKGMLNPEATTIERSLDLLGYEVFDTQTVNIIKFSMENEDKNDVKSKVNDMCERMLCNPVIHDYEISINSEESCCGMDHLGERNSCQLE